MTFEQKKLLKDIEQAALNIDVHLERKRVFEEFASNTLLMYGSWVRVSTGSQEEKKSLAIARLFVFMALQTLFS